MMGGQFLMIRKILKYVGIAIASLAIVVLSSALLYRKYLQHKVARLSTVVPALLSSL
jgi:hypothetical protein